MKQVNVSALKARLSSFLSEVRAGETVLVCDRRTPIARLVPIEDEDDDFRIDPPSSPVRPLQQISRVRLRKKVDLVELLRQSRDQR